MLSAIVCGATVAFLVFNYHPARIFMGDTGALSLGFLLAAIAVQGVMKTAATVALVGPLLVLAVPIFDTSFVVLKRLKYHRPPWSADQNHFYHRFMRIGLSQRRTAAYLHLWAALLSAYAILLRFAPPRPHGVWDLSNTILALAGGLIVIATSIWMVYALEILKQRHLEALRLNGTCRRRISRKRCDRPSRPGVGNGPAQEVGRVPAHAVAPRLRSGFLRISRSAGSVSIRSRPSAISCSSTAPGRPSKIDQTGVPSTAASRFMVPPAETSRSASATRLRPSTGLRNEHAGQAERCDRVRLLGRAADDDRLRVAGVGDALQQPGKERVLGAAEVERVRRRSPDHADGVRRVGARSGSSTAVSGSKSARKYSSFSPG